MRILIPVLVFLALFPLVALSQVLDRVAYIGDSETEEGGIGHGLVLTKTNSGGCLNNANIIGFHGASAAVYAAQKSCFLPHAYQQEQYFWRTLKIRNQTTGEVKSVKRKVVSCASARSRFEQVIHNSKIKTVAVALGDNYSSGASFRDLLTQIKQAGKSCVWVMPSQKQSGDKGQAAKSIRDYISIAQTICGRKNIINPSEDGERFKTAGDHLHYLKPEGAKIAAKICAHLVPNSQRPGTVDLNSGNARAAR